MGSAAAVIDLESFRKQRQAARPAASTTMPWCPVWVWVMLVPVR